MRMPQGVLDAKLTPLQALGAGLLVDIDAVPASMRDALVRELKTDRSPANAPMLHDVKTTVMLIEANAVVGMGAERFERRRTDQRRGRRQGWRDVRDLSHRNG